MPVVNVWRAGVQIGDAQSCTSKTTPQAASRSRFRRTRTRIARASQHVGVVLIGHDDEDIRPIGGLRVGDGRAGRRDHRNREDGEERVSFHGMMVPFQ